MTFSIAYQVSEFHRLLKKVRSEHEEQRLRALKRQLGSAVPDIPVELINEEYLRDES